MVPSADLYHRGLDLRGRYGFALHDAHIVAAALAAGCARPISEDLQDGQRIEGLAVVDPFRGGA